jgi:apolipoprotein N-acyltransferase
VKKFLSFQQERTEYLWFALGFILSLFATNGRWDIALAAWLYPLFFLRFARTRSPFVGFYWLWLASTTTMLFFFYQSQLLNPLISVACLIFSTVLTLPYLFDRLLAPRISQTSVILTTLVFPLSRVVCEFLVSSTPFGSLFSLAYTQYGNLPLLQILSITGIYGVSFLMAWSASIGNTIWEHHLSWPRIRRVTLLYGGLLTLVLLGGGLRLTFFPPSTQTVRIAGISVASATRQKLLQARSNFTTKEQLTHADLSPLRSAFALNNDELLARSQREARAGASIVVWPEAGALTMVEDESSLLEHSKALARQERIYLEMGLVILQYKASSLRALYDRAMLLDPRGQVVWTYDKAHPVPGMESFAPGDGKVPVIDTPYGRLANVICFDGDFLDLMRQGGNKGADLMLVPSNDWAGIDPMHTQHSTFRAIENGYSLVRQTSNGLAITVDYQGHVLAASDYFTTNEQTMIAFVPMKGVQTIYALVGDLFAWLSLAGLLLLAGFIVLRLLRNDLTSSSPGKSMKDRITELTRTGFFPVETQ